MKDKTFRELAEMLEEIALALDAGGKEFVSIADDIVIAGIRLKQTITDHQETARGSKTK